MPRWRPNRQSTLPPRITALIERPSADPMTGRHGTSEKPKPSLSMAKRPLASMTEPRYTPETVLPSVTGQYQSRVRGDCFRCRRDFAVAECVEQICREYDSLIASLREPFLDQKIDACLHGVACCDGEATGGVI